jgi:16S rRNA (cytosine1402-N4)-methyltransferase
MRLAGAGGETAADILARKDENILADLFFALGEEKYSRRIARAVVKRRGVKSISTAREFAELVQNVVPAAYRHGRIHPATRCFQALRIAVNQELERLDRVLPLALDILPGGGRLGVISFHSLDDRRVKNFFREKNKVCSCPPEAPVCTCGRKRTVNLLTRKALKPGEDECRRNSPSRSARFRVAEKIAVKGGREE